MVETMTLQQLDALRASLGLPSVANSPNMASSLDPTSTSFLPSSTINTGAPEAQVMATPLDVAAASSMQDFNHVVQAGISAAANQVTSTLNPQTQSYVNTGNAVVDAITKAFIDHPIISTAVAGLAGTGAATAIGDLLHTTKKAPAKHHKRAVSHMFKRRSSSRHVTRSSSGHLKKGSLAAKRHMARLRKMRK